jgi:tRNA pseudouridine38-40 synthase
MELQYDATGLHGWAKQDGLQTVEGCLEEAFGTVLDHAPVLRVAGRTDAGVHARRQVVSLSLPDGLDLAKLRRSLNALTPPGIAVLAIRRAAAAFDARKDATSRSYRYFLCADPVVSPFWTRYCWQVCGYDLDLAAMTGAAALVAGRHHLTAFTPTETEHVFFDRTVLRCRWARVAGAALPGVALGRAPRGADGHAAAPSSLPDASGRGLSAGEAARGMLCLEIEADAFLRHMVRSLVGTMVEVGRGERSIEDFARLLEGAPREAAGATAPPHGLFLWDITYGRQQRGGPSPRMNLPAYGKIPDKASAGGAAEGGVEAAGEAGRPLRHDTADSEA